MTILKTALKTTLAAGALLAAAALPASAQSWGFGFSSGDRLNGYYSDYGRSYGDRYHYGYYGRPHHYWRHRRDWDDEWRYRRWHHRWNDWD